MDVAWKNGGENAGDVRFLGRIGRWRETVGDTYEENMSARYALSFAIKGKVFVNLFCASA